MLANLRRERQIREMRAEDQDVAQAKLWQLKEKLRKLEERTGTPHKPLALRSADTGADGLARKTEMDVVRGELNQLTDTVPKEEKSDGLSTRDLFTTKNNLGEEVRSTSRLAGEDLSKRREEAAQERSLAQEWCSVKDEGSEAHSAEAEPSVELSKARGLIDSLTSQRIALERELHDTKAALEVARAQLRQQAPNVADARSEVNYFDPVRFGISGNKDIRIQNAWWRGSLGVDIREYQNGRPTRKVCDASAAALLLSNSFHFRASELL